MKILASTAALAVAIGASPAHAIDASKSIEIAAPPAKVWTTIGDFCGIGQWHPAIEKCVLSMKDGKHVRTLSLKGGGTIVEEQLARDDKAMHYSYKILESPLPVADYTSKIQVVPHGSGSKVTWSGKFKAHGADDAKALGVIDGIYDGGLAAIAAKTK